MAEQEPNRVQTIDWAGSFPFSRIFRSFRIAIHLPKLLLTLLLVISVFLGGTILDVLWGRASLEGSLDLYGPGGAAFVQNQDQQMRQWVSNRAELLTTAVLDYEGDDADERRDRARDRFIARYGSDVRGAYRHLRSTLEDYHRKRIEAAEDEDQQAQRRRDRDRALGDLDGQWLRVNAEAFGDYTARIRPAGAEALRPRDLPEGVRAPTTRQFRRAMAGIERGFVAALMIEYGAEMGFDRQVEPDPEEEAEDRADPALEFFNRYAHRPQSAVSRARTLIREEFAQRIEEERQRLQEELEGIDEEDEDARHDARRRSERAIERLERQRDQAIDDVRALHDEHFRGVFATVMVLWGDAANRIVDVVPNPIMAERLPPDAPLVTRVNEALQGLRNVFYEAPVWLMRAHLGFFIIFLPLVLALLAFIGGAMFRMTALHATRDERIPAMEAVRFAQGKFIWYFLAPLAPLLAVLIVGVILMVGGFILFNRPFGWEWLAVPLNIIGGALMFLALLGGFVMTIMLIGLAGGGGLLYPAVATEGTDAFDAVSRAYAYLLGRPWRWLLYNLVGLVYIAITFLFVTWVVGLTRDLSVFFVSSGVVSTLDVGQTPVNRFDVMVEREWEAMPGGARVAAALVYVWLFVLGGLAVAFLINVFAAVQTNIYLLLRHAADGTEYDDVYIEAEEPTPPTAPSTPDKVEPTGETPAAGAGAAGATGAADAAAPPPAAGEQPATESGGEAGPEEPSTQPPPPSTPPGGPAEGQPSEPPRDEDRDKGTHGQGESRSPDSPR